MKWTLARTAELIKLRARGVPTDGICTALKLTRGAIAGQLHRALGKRRKNPKPFPGHPTATEALMREARLETWADRKARLAANRRNGMFE